MCNSVSLNKASQMGSRNGFEQYIILAKINLDNCEIAALTPQIVSTKKWGKIFSEWMIKEVEESETDK